MGKSPVYVTKEQRVAVCRICKFHRGDHRYVCTRGLMPKECEYVFYAVHPYRFCSECAFSGKRCPFNGVRAECYYWWAFSLKALGSFCHWPFTPREVEIVEALLEERDEEVVCKMLHCTRQELRRQKSAIVSKIKGEWRVIRDGIK